MKQFILYIPMLLLLVACGKKDDNTPPRNPDVYVAGDVNGEAVLWKNDTVQNLSLPNSSASSATSVFVSGADVYIAGYTYNNVFHNEATIWKNGILAYTVDEYSVANSIFVSGTDYYAVTSGGSSALLIKNNTLQNSSVNFTYTSVFVSGTYIYVAGWTSVNTAFIWETKDGIMQTLPDQSHGSAATSVFVSGNDVYVAGVVRNAADNYMVTIWKNGVAQSLTDGSQNAYATSVYVSGNNVYVAGYISQNGNEIAMLWKNGVAQALTDGTSDAYASSVFVSGKDVYVAGYKTVGGFRVATLWKNGVATSLSNNNSFAQANAVFVQ